MYLSIMNKLLENLSRKHHGNEEKGLLTEKQKLYGFIKDSNETHPSTSSGKISVAKTK